MTKKGTLVWLFSSLTFISLLHLIDALSAIVLNNEIKLLKLYPFAEEKLQTITPPTYFWISAISTFILWGITCAISFENPVEAFLNKILSEAKAQSAVETQLVEDKSEILDIMNETVEANNEMLANVKDLVYNIRAEVKEIEPLKEMVEKMRTELNSLKREFKKINIPNVCTTCGRPLLSEIKTCTNCREKVISLKQYK